MLVFRIFYVRNRHFSLGKIKNLCILLSQTMSMDFTKVLIVHHKWSFAFTITIESIFEAWIRQYYCTGSNSRALVFNPTKDDFDLHCDLKRKKNIFGQFIGQETHCCLFIHSYTTQHNTAHIKLYLIRFLFFSFLILQTTLDFIVPRITQYIPIRRPVMLICIRKQ